MTLKYINFDILFFVQYPALIIWLKFHAFYFKNKSDQYLWVFFSIDQFSFPKQASSLPESKFFIGCKSLKLVL